MKRFKAITALLLAVLLLCSAAPLNALAAELETEAVGEDYPQLVLDTPYDVEITQPGQRPMLQFVPAESGVYRFNSYSTPSRSHYLYIYNENMNELRSSYSTNIHIDCSMEAGKTYYVKPYYPGDYYGTVTITVEKPPVATELQLSCGAAVEITLGSRFRIDTTFLPAGVAAETVTWESSDDSLVSVNNGTVTANALGVATITATSENGLTAACAVTVTETPRLVLDTPHEVAITQPGQRPMLQFVPAESGVYRFNSYSTPSRSHYLYIYNESMNELRSSYSTNIHIDCSMEAGKTYYVKPYYPGDYYGTFTVTVEKPPVATELQLSCGAAVEITLGTSFQINTTFLPAGVAAETVTWESSDDSLVSVNNGNVKANALGVATITATSENGLTASCRIAVVAAPMRGDADGNGKVDVSDATEIQRYLAEMQVTSDARVLQCGDVTGDNKVNINDVTAIQRFLAELEDPYHIGELL